MIKNVHKYGGYIYKNAQNMYTEKGRPDLTACIPTTFKALTELFGDREIGVFLGLEVKRDKDIYDASKAQEIVGRKIKKAKGLWFVIDDPNIVEALMINLTKYNKEVTE